MTVRNNGLGSQNIYYAQLNRAKLAQALQKNPCYQQKVQETSGKSQALPVPQIDRVSLQEDLDFTETYVNSMTNLMQAASRLRPNSLSDGAGKLDVQSSDTAVAEVSERMTLRNSMELTVSVSQLATAQQNSSQGVRGYSLASGDLDFTITDGSNQFLTVEVSTNNEEGVARTNRELMEEAASLVNGRKEFGVRAYVEERDGNVSLRLQSKETGVKNGFHVSVESGSLMGLDQERTAAQDAVYSTQEGRNSREYRSSSNQVTLDYGRVNMTLKAVGEADISIQPDVEQVADAFKTLVDSYNQAITMLNSNSSRGTGVAMHLRSFQQGLGPSSSLERMGVTANKDGTLSLDSKAFMERMKAEPELTKTLLSGNHSIAQTAFNKANAALRTSFESLINRSHGMRPEDNMNLLFANYGSLGLMIDYLV